MSRRWIVMASATGALVAAAVSLVVVAGSTAGNQKVPFNVFGAPTQVTAGDQGLVFVKFGPNATGGAATHTQIIFTFPVGSFDTNVLPAADPATSSDCGAAQPDKTPNPTVYTITCNVPTVSPGTTVKRFVTYTASTTLTNDAGITAQVSYDAGSGSSGGASNQAGPFSAGVSIVNGGTTDGKCDGTSGTVQTTSLPSGALQQTLLNYTNASAGLQLPCSWAAVGVTSTGNLPPKPKPGAPLISTVAGPLYANAAQLTITFSSLPVPLNKFVLEEFDPTQQNPAWTVVPPCGTDPVTGQPTLPKNADTCLIGYGKGKPIVANLLYAGTGGDPSYN